MLICFDALFESVWATLEGVPLIYKSKSRDFDCFFMLFREFNVDIAAS